MADLLECLIQIKALEETLRAAASLAGREPAGVEPAPVWRRMADAERRYATALGTESGIPDAVLPPTEQEAAGDRDVFIAWRRANLAVLSRCSAASLAGPVEWQGRPSTTVADLVAIMLASDTDFLGELRRRHPGG